MRKKITNKIILKNKFQKLKKTRILWHGKKKEEKGLDVLIGAVIVSGKNGTTNKRWGRKKKTLDELKEEEILLLGERRHLKKEIAELCVNVEKERARNESLKRLKVRFLPTLLLHTDVFLLLYSVRICHYSFSGFKSSCTRY
ncbi:hypothetical protein HYC85_004409 [Camellia sinensis]|uniref:Uncharacterized protein n=1 Tax=Camellia sinensis TaxID=4442 RepID=A0A7J7HYK2_CAMSI|nr:hypothetical protein HYC85_004409 [Camellia sinensis]